MTKSEILFERAQKIIPGGVNSPVRAFKSVGGSPRFIQRAKGARLRDVDGNSLVDFVMSWGPLILGHAPDVVVQALREAAEDGTSYGAPSEHEVVLAELITRAMPAVEMIRMVNSGTEATMSAVRLARAFTGREKIVKFAGCYHGHADGFLIQSGSGGLTFGVPNSPGVTKGAAADTLLARYNDAESVERLLRENPGQVAAVIVEPIAGNMGLVPPAPDFLPALRALTREAGALLIFDEVISGFRVGLGGAQEKYGVRPDLVTLGKIIGGGLPVGAFGGRRDIMRMMAPEGPVYQAGTLSGNPLAMRAGYATLKTLVDHPDLYGQLDCMGEYLEMGLRAKLDEVGLPLQLVRIGSMLCLFFTEKPVLDLDSAMLCDTARYFQAMLGQGVYLPPAQFETFFVSTAHTREDLDLAVEACGKSLRAVRDKKQ
jgi:glutamate-1-semialdehyde 2,1-aminomutase